MSGMEFERRGSTDGDEWSQRRDLRLRGEFLARAVRGVRCGERNAAHDDEALGQTELSLPS